jgi:hypothetical protein
MTHRLALAICVISATLGACKNAAPAAEAVASTPGVTDCSPNHNAGTRKCPNLLALGWENFSSPASLIGLASDLDRMRPPNPVENVDFVKQIRKATIECRKDKDENETKTVDVTYVRPKGMGEFPVNGTGSADLVVALFVANADQDCPEFRYGAVKKQGAQGRVIQFATVRTQATVPPSESSRDDIVIGEWRVWAIEKQGNNYRKHEVRRGAFVRCGFEHSTSIGNTAFITCGDARRLHQLARDSVGVSVAGDGPSAVDRAFAGLIAEYNRGDKAFRDKLLLVGDPFEAPAWGRCGNLGCCASY